MIVYYIGGPADLVKQAIPDKPLTPVPTCLVYTMAVPTTDGLVAKRHFYRRMFYLGRVGAWVYEYDPSIEEVQ